jgi:hypothetical protein
MGFRYWIGQAPSAYFGLSDPHSFNKKQMQRFPGAVQAHDETGTSAV